MKVTSTYGGLAATAVARTQTARTVVPKALRPQVRTRCTNCGDSAAELLGVGRVFDLDARLPDYGIGGRLREVRGIGAVMGLGALEVADDKPSEAMVRATNLANVITLGLKYVKPEIRRTALVEIGGEAWTRRVLAVARRVGIGLEDATRFGLALSFLIGIIDAETGQDTGYATAYKTARKLYEDAEPVQLSAERKRAFLKKAVPSLVPEDVPQQVGALSDYWDRLWDSEPDRIQWCVSKFGDPWPEGSPYRSDPPRARRDGGPRFDNYVKCRKKGLTHPKTEVGLLFRGLPGNFAERAVEVVMATAKTAVVVVVEGATAAGDAASDALDKAFNWTGDILCKGLKWLFPKPVEFIGDILCKVFSTFLKYVKYTFQAFIEITKAIGKGLIEVLDALIEGDGKKAGLAFLKSITVTLFLSPPLGSSLALLLGVSMRQLSTISARVAQEHPLFIVSVAAAVLGLMSLTPQAVIAVIEALRPALVIFGAVAVARLIANAKLPQLEIAVDSVIGLSIAITNGVINAARVVNDIVDRISKAGGVVAAAQGEYERRKKIVEAKLNDLIDKFKKFKFNDVLNALVAFCGLKGIVGKTIGEGPPDPKALLAKAERELKKLSPSELAKHLDPAQIKAFTDEELKKLDPTALRQRLDPSKVKALTDEELKKLDVQTLKTKLDPSKMKGLAVEQVRVDPFNTGVEAIVHMDRAVETMTPKQQEEFFTKLNTRYAT